MNVTQPAIARLPQPQAAMGGARGAYVLFEGLPATVVDSQVFTHVRIMREELNIDMHVLVFAAGGEVFVQALSRRDRAQAVAGGRVDVFRCVRPGLPGSQLINGRLLAAELERIGPISFLHARGDYAASVVGPVACTKEIPMLWDCRGDACAEIQARLEAAPLPRRMVLQLRHWLAARELRGAAKTCTAVCCVSEPLQEVISPHIGGKPNWVVPCLADERQFYFSSELRAEMRSRLSISEDEKVLVYSGSLAEYQCFDEMLALFGANLSNGARLRLIVLTPETEAARRKMKNLPADRVICLAVPNSEVNAYLNAADFGFLLRDSTPLNRAAFPTKFSEYALAGLRVIMKESPPTCVKIARELGILVDTSQLGPELSIDADRAAAATVAGNLLGRRGSLNLFASIYGELQRRLV